MTINWNREKRGIRHTPIAPVTSLMSPVQSPSLSTPSSTPLNTTGPPDTHDEGCIWTREEEEAPAYDMLDSSGILDFQFLDIRSHEHCLSL